MLVQEYLPAGPEGDWITELYCPADGAAPLAFTGVKIRSWPPGAGVATRVLARENPALAEQAAEFCRRLGYRGVADLDWRLDPRDGRYKLVDFNPRTGAGFRLFETADGVDVVRAPHLGSDRSSAADRRPAAGLGAWWSGNWTLPRRRGLGLRRERRPPPEIRPRRGTERAWLSRDDPAPLLAESAWFTAAGRPPPAVPRSAVADRAHRAQQVPFV